MGLYNKRSHKAHYGTQTKVLKWRVAVTPCDSRNDRFPTKTRPLLSGSEVAQTVSSHKAPERALLAVLATKFRGESLMSLAFAEIRNPRRETGAFLKMTRRVFVSAGAGMIETEFDHGAQGHGGRQRMFVGQRIGDGSQYFVLIAI
jgi:hypothetical protein